MGAGVAAAGGEGVGGALGERLAGERVLEALALGEAESAERVAVAVSALALALGEGLSEGSSASGSVSVTGMNWGVYSTSPSCQVCTLRPPSASVTVALDSRPAQPPTPPHSGYPGPQGGHWRGKSCSVAGGSAPAR